MAVDLESQTLTTTVPATMDELRSVIVANHEDLSRRMKQVASIILDHPEDLAFETLAVVAERSGVQPSAIVRFAKALGFSGASQMQKIIRDELLASNITLAYGERVRQFNESLTDSSGRAVEGILAEYVAADSLSLERLGQSVTAEDIDAAVERLIAADTVYIAGFRRAFPISSYLAYFLQRSGKKAIFIDGTGGFWGHQIRTIGPKDLLIAVTYQPYAEETVKCAHIAAEQGAPIIGITDSKVSPLAKLAVQSLLVREAEVRSFRSLTATLCLVQSLVIAYAFAAQTEG